MRKLFGILALLLFSACVLADQSKIRIFCNRRHETLASQLSDLLGPSYKVDSSEVSPRNVHSMDRPRDEEFKAALGEFWVYPDPLFPYPPVTPDVLVIDLSPDSDGWSHWQDIEDTFLMRGRIFVNYCQSVLHPKRIDLVILPEDRPQAIFTQYFVPLVKQIARESDVNVVDLSNSLDAPTGLFLAIVNVQHNPGTWHVLSATSEQIDEGPAKNAIDNNPDTYWHTRYDPNPTKVPHEIVIDLVKTETLNGFSYLARQDGGVNGRVKDFEIYLSDDPNKRGEPALKGTLQNTMNEQRLLFPKAATGRYLKFVALSEVNGNIWTSIAELGILPAGTSK